MQDRYVKHVKYGPRGAEREQEWEEVRGETNWCAPTVVLVHFIHMCRNSLSHHSFVFTCYCCCCCCCVGEPSADITFVIYPSHTFSSLLFFPPFIYYALPRHFLPRLFLLNTRHNFILSVPSTHHLSQHHTALTNGHPPPSLHCYLFQYNNTDLISHRTHNNTRTCSHPSAY
ncbi:hypothetical protein F5H01DRAFT_84970 [Linnemannia elongata]|nr:hypothetical protein F5H01DRAFT_84970 [Linnemannia elongata]